jgi:hypothetical protein
MHCQNIYYLSKQSGIETFLAVAVSGSWPGNLFFLLFEIHVVGFNHIYETPYIFSHRVVIRRGGE